MHSIYDKGGKLGDVKGALFQSLYSGKRVLFFVPRCLRYYYDDKGDQQIIGSLNDYTYLTLSGKKKTKKAQKVKQEILEELQLPIVLSSLGFPIEVLCPVMDHELQRPERMSTEGNFGKTKRYKEDVNTFFASQSFSFPITAVSSLTHFGIPSHESLFRDITGAVQRYEHNGYGITNATFEYAVTEEYERNKTDKERSSYYRSRDFARLCRLYDLGEAYVHANKMVDFAINGNYAGVFVHLPRGADFDKLVFNFVQQLVVYT